MRSWILMPGKKRLVLIREGSAILASVLLGLYFAGPTPIDVAFSVWSFCLGQLVVTLFDASDGDESLEFSDLSDPAAPAS
jgi:hypothetical protein